MAIDERSALEQFTQTLRKLRESRGVSYKEMAHLLDLTTSRYWKIENGKGGPGIVIPTRETILKIAEALRLTEGETDELLLAGRRLPLHLEETLARRPYLASVIESLGRLDDYNLQCVILEIEKREKAA